VSDKNIHGDRTWSGQDPWEVYEHVYTTDDDGCGHVTIGLSPTHWQMVSGEKVYLTEPWPVRVIVQSNDKECQEAYLSVESAEELLRDLENVVDHARLARGGS
jgi:hypothetical protein